MAPGFSEFHLLKFFHHATWNARLERLRSGESVSTSSSSAAVRPVSAPRRCRVARHRSALIEQADFAKERRAARPSSCTRAAVSASGERVARLRGVARNAAGSRAMRRISCTTSRSDPELQGWEGPFYGIGLKSVRQLAASSGSSIRATSTARDAATPAHRRARASHQRVIYHESVR